jgi:hypothetical protein
METRTGGSEVQGQPGVHSETLSLKNKTKQKRKQMLVAHVYNPSYSRGRDQEDQGLKQVQANSVRPYLKNTQHKKGLVE